MALDRTIMFQINKTYVEETKESKRSTTIKFDVKVIIPRGIN